VPLDDSGRLNQHHRLQTARPQSVEPDPEQAIDRDQSEPTRPLATQNVQLVTEGEVLQFQNHPMTESTTETMERMSLSMPATLRRPIRNSRLFTAFGVFGSHRLGYRLNPHRQKDYAKQSLFSKFFWIL
jgi:hypothetical protein